MRVRVFGVERHLARHGVQHVRVGLNAHFLEVRLFCPMHGFQHVLHGRRPFLFVEVPESAFGQDVVQRQVADLLAVAVHDPDRAVRRPVVRGALVLVRQGVHAPARRVVHDRVRRVLHLLGVHVPEGARLVHRQPVRRRLHAAHGLQVVAGAFLSGRGLLRGLAEAAQDAVVGVHHVLVAHHLRAQQHGLGRHADVAQLVVGVRLQRADPGPVLLDREALVAHGRQRLAELRLGAEGQVVLVADAVARGALEHGLQQLLLHGLQDGGAQGLQVLVVGVQLGGFHKVVERSAEAHAVVVDGLRFLLAAAVEQLAGQLAGAGLQRLGREDPLVHDHLVAPQPRAAELRQLLEGHPVDVLEHVGPQLKHLFQEHLVPLELEPRKGIGERGHDAFFLAAGQRFLVVVRVEVGVQLEAAHARVLVLGVHVVLDELAHQVHHFLVEPPGPEPAAVQAEEPSGAAAAAGAGLDQRFVFPVLRSCLRAVLHLEETVALLAFGNNSLRAPLLQRRLVLVQGVREHGANSEFWVPLGRKPEGAPAKNPQTTDKTKIRFPACGARENKTHTEPKTCKKKGAETTRERAWGALTGARHPR